MARRTLGHNALLAALGPTLRSCACLIALTGGAVAQPAPSASKADPAPAPAPQAPAAAPTGTSAVVMDLSAIESVIGKSVKSSGGEDLGRIVDLLVTPSGQVRAAVIDFGGVLGVGTRKIAIDWKALDFTNFAKDGDVRLALTRNQVRMSPEYKSGDPVVILQASRPEEAKAVVAAPLPPTKPNPAPAANPVPANPVPANPVTPASAPQGEAHKQ